MQEGDNLRVALRDNISRETAEGGTSGAACVNDGGDACIYPALVRMDTQSGEAFKHMSMQIDQAGSDNRPRHLDHAPRFSRCDLRFDARDFALLNGYVLNAVKAG